MSNIFSKLFSNSNGRSVKKISSLVERINNLEQDFQSLTDSQLRSKTVEFKERFANHETLDDLLPEAFAAVREASLRTIGLRHFDVQLIGGVVLHQGKVAEMRTGEGKTLVATLPVYLNALSDQGVHVVTVNDYLARRDLQWMGPIYSALGLTATCLQHESANLFDLNAKTDDPVTDHLVTIDRSSAYLADITYGTNHEFGFDYLRDNMAVDISQVVQRGLNFVIVDEVDNILIDEARTPLIISGPAQSSTQMYGNMTKLVPRLKSDEDFVVDEKQKSVNLTDVGISKMERFLNVDNLYDPDNISLTHYIENALRAQVVYHRDQDYVVKDGQVVIVDEFTGRLMEGRRYGSGLHQAIESKEGVRVQQEMLTYATVTLQNYFRMYKKLAGMTGTAVTESEELMSIYHLDVVVVPTHRPMVRVDHPDYIFKTAAAKWTAIVEDIENCYKLGRPVLVGTTSIENSERISGALKQCGVPHEVLNAKNHQREAEIIAQAGEKSAVTVATNMAGRGTDIILGGNPDAMLSQRFRETGLDGKLLPDNEFEKLKKTVQHDWLQHHEEVVALGGLYVLGTEKHEARRIDNQLRGRAGRQGDPGSSRFYVGLDDDLMRRFGGERVQGLMQRAGIEENQPIEMNLVSKAIGWAQNRVEGHHFEIRKNLVQYDDVNNKHREVIYGERRKILEGIDVQDNIWPMIENEIQNVFALHLAEDGRAIERIEEFIQDISLIFPIPDELQSSRLQNM
ncbi:preprotein translocase subunit SecA, partial [SAR202 cluster bacterium AD-802-E10_MRT_200m]|nr:preprotein translocase subunit SecA [SAR202 cluster bacterium AD-802-E10_MRT_200m]